MLDFTLSAAIKQVAGNVYASLQKHFEEFQASSTPVLPVVSSPQHIFPASSYSTPLKDSTSRFINTPSSLNNVGNKGGSSFFSESASTKKAVAKTFTVYIRTLSDETKSILEQKLLVTTGVLSFQIDLPRHRASIRTTKTSAELINSIKESGLPALIVPADLEGSPARDEKENEFPQYLPEASAPSSSGWFSSIVSWGSTTVEERKEAQKRNETKKSYISNR
jgi:hypothetical protein